MAVFKAFKPEAMNKIAKSMGYTGNMGEFQNYIEQDPARQARMEQFKNAAVQMAKGGVVKMQTGGLPGSFDKPKGGLNPRADDPRNAPMYNQFLQSPEYQNSLGQAGAAVVMPVQEGGQTYSFGSAVQGEAYKDYMQRMRSGGPVGSPLAQPQGIGQPLMSADGTLGTLQPAAEPDYSGMTFEQAQARQAQRDVKSPAEAAAIQAAIARGPSTAQQATSPAAQTTPTNIGDATVQRMFQPGLPQGGVTQAAFTPNEAGQYVDPRTGMVTGSVAVPTAMATTAQAAPQQEKAANVMEAAAAAPAVDAAMNATQAAQTDPNDPRAQVTAAQQTASSVGDLAAAQGNATLINSPVQRNIQAGELITGAADAQTAAQFTEQVQAATATPSAQATVQGQLAQLTANFDATNPPAWAAGALRNATQQMAARGLGASSIAGQAIVQATIEAALPIAQADASITAQFETQNLSNRQQRAMLAAQQRAQFIGQEFDQEFQARVQNAAKISDAANMNFTAEQQVQLENSRAANTMNLNNLSNSQAMVMAEASALAQMDAANLNNRQQSAVMNAQSFLQMDMANLSNRQQTDLFKAQQRIQSLFTDQAAANAARQFNASSQNQVDQFFANLSQQTSQFNATQSNAQAQFNAGQANTVNRFNAELNNQRDQFNAQNQVVIAQSNAQWRRQIATADTAAVNRANELNAAAVLDISKQSYDNLWNYYADTMEWAWTSAENDKDRVVQMALGELSAKTQENLAKLKLDAEESGAIGGFFSDILTSQAGSIASRFIFGS